MTAARLVRLLLDAAERDMQGRKGRMLVAAEHTWAGTAARLTELLK